jgi:hypothetical protein
MAKKEAVAFSARLAGKLKQMADSWSPGGSSRGNMAAGNAVGCWMMQAMGEIPAAAGTCATPGSLIGITPGAGLARICYRDRITGLLVPYRPNGYDITNVVFSLKRTKIKDGGYFLGTRDLNGSIWVEEYYNFCPCQDGGKTVTVVTKVTFDTTACKLVVCTRDLCLPPEANIGEENCGGSGGSGSGATPVPGG